MTETAMLPPEAVDALRAGNKIEAIKQVRVATGCGLAEAKALVEAFERGSPQPTTMPHPTAKPRPAATGLSPGEMPRPMSNPWKAIAAVLAIAVAALAVLLLLR